jgi:lipopolysaccharide transport system permease protein
MIASFWSNRNLIATMVKREVVGRYRGSVMGIGWSFFNPLLMLIIYTFVFSVVFKARWGIGNDESKTDFAIMLFVGIIIHGIFAECINRAPGLILGNVNYVKKVIFPLEVLPWIAMGSALFHAAISLIILLTVQLILNHNLPWTLIIIPLIILPLIFATMGVAWLLSSLGVFVRDIGQFTGILTMVLLFVSPIFYPISALPAKFRPILMANPLTFIIEQARAVLIFRQLPDWTGLCIYSLIALIVAWMGYAWFQKTRKGFADVI